MAQMRITDGKGVHFTFDNGVTISIQIGGGNYGENYNHPIGREGRDIPLPPSSTAEFACWDRDGGWFDIDGDQVAGYVPVTKVLAFMDYLRSLPDGVKASAIKLDTAAIQSAA